MNYPVCDWFWLTKVVISYDSTSYTLLLYRYQVLVVNYLPRLHSMWGSWGVNPHLCDSKTLIFTTTMLFTSYGIGIVIIFFFWDKVSLLLPRLEFNGVISAHCNPRLPVSSDSLASAYQVAEITSINHQAPFILYFYYRSGFTMLIRLVSSSWPQMIHPPRLFEVLGLQVWATTPYLDAFYFFFSPDFSG